MAKFGTRIVEDIKGREPVEELVINGFGAFEILENELIGSTYINEMDSMKAYIQHLANGGNAGRRLKLIKGGRSGLTEYEFIGSHLRVYGIQQPGKKLIIFGGKKKKADSSDNIADFQNLLEQYQKSL
ncbi:MAG: hypothetical protein ABIT05_05130 [Chitinophagaceae bacterium]